MHCEKGLRPYVFSPPGKQLNVPQPGFSPLYTNSNTIQIQIIYSLFFNQIQRHRSIHIHISTLVLIVIMIIMRKIFLYLYRT